MFVHMSPCSCVQLSTIVHTCLFVYLFVCILPLFSTSGSTPVPRAPVHSAETFSKTENYKSILIVCWHNDSVLCRRIVHHMKLFYLQILYYNSCLLLLLFMCRMMTAKMIKLDFTQLYHTYIQSILPY